MTTNTNSTLRDEVLASISAIDEAVIESDMSVTMALMDASDKAMMIMENYTGDDVDAFTFFQEASKWDPKHPFKEDNALMTIIKFIPNLIRLIINKLDTLFNGDRRTAVEKFADAVKSGGPKVANLIGQLGEIADNHKAELIIGGTAISIAGIEAVFKPIQKALNAARKVITGVDTPLDTPGFKAGGSKYEHDGKQLASLEGLSISKDGTGFDTKIDFVAMAGWFDKIADSVSEFDTAINAKKTESKLPSTKDDPLKKLEDAASKYNNELGTCISEWKKTKGFKSKKTFIDYDEFKAIWLKVAKKTKDTKGMIASAQTNLKATTNESNADEMKRINAITAQLNSNVSTIQSLIGQMMKYFAVVSDVHSAITNSIEELAKKHGLPFNSFKDAALAIADNVKGWADKFKKGNVNDDPELNSDLEGGEYGLSDSKRKSKADTPATTDFSTDDLNPDEEMTASKKDIKNVNKVAESYEGTIDDDDTVVLESVEYTKDLQTIEKTAKTVDEVNKLKAETFSSVKNVKYKAGKKALIIEGYSKIKHDTDKVKKPKDNETWDDVDMSAHDRRDPVRLIITGPGAEAYAESKKGGKKVVEECGDTGCSKPKTVTESPDTSWYYTR